MTKCSKICDCIEAYTVALACAEALEHNAITGKILREIWADLSREVTPEALEELEFRHPLTYPISEPIAEMAILICLSDIKDKCRIETEEIRKTVVEGLEANRKSQFGAAQQKFVEAKSKLLDTAKKLCEG